jgi:hypothetical protein
VSAIGFARSVIAWVTLRKKFGPQKAPFEQPSVFKFSMLAPYITSAIILLYCILFQKTGYILSTLIVPPVFIFFLGSKKWHVYLSTYLFAFVLFAIFKIIMRIPLR